MNYGGQESPSLKAIENQIDEVIAAHAGAESPNLLICLCAPYPLMLLCLFVSIRDVNLLFFPRLFCPSAPIPCLLSSVSCLLSSVSCLLSPVFCLLSSVSCLLPTPPIPPILPLVLFCSYLLCPSVLCAFASLWLPINYAKQTQFPKTKN